VCFAICFEEGGDGWCLRDWGELIKRRTFNLVVVFGGIIRQFDDIEA
jgi:hypothetical protein